MWSLELIFVMLGVGAIGTSLILGNYGGLLFLVPATAAYAYVLWMTLRESRGRRSK
jgi:succinate-acetate transporter protein